PAISEKRSAEMIFVPEPISKTVSPLGRRKSSELRRPAEMMCRPLGAITPMTMPTLPSLPPSALIRVSSRLRISGSSGRRFALGFSGAEMPASLANNKAQIQYLALDSINVEMRRSKLWIQQNGAHQIHQPGERANVSGIF